MLQIIQKAVLNPVFQALVIAVLFILFIPARMNKYRTTVDDVSLNFDRSEHFFADLDHDGLSEHIHTFINETGSAAMIIKMKNIHDQQWNLNGAYPRKAIRLMVGDYNQNSKEEIYLFTQKMDSVNLHIFEFRQFGLDTLLYNRFITKINKRIGDPDYMIRPGKVCDMTGDGRGDLVFAINAGHARTPRNVFIYDIQHDAIKISPESNAYITSIHLDNLDDDPFNEILLNTAATNNCNEEAVPYSDASSWLMALDEDLHFLFPPIEYPGPTGEVFASTVQNQNEKFILCASRSLIISDFQFRLMKVDLQGRIIIDKLVRDDFTHDKFYLMPSLFKTTEHAIPGFIDEFGIFRIDKNLEYQKISNINQLRKAPVFMDIDLDGSDEMIIHGIDETKLLFYRQNFKNVVSIDFPIQPNELLFSLKLNGNSPPQLSIQGDSEWKLISFSINPMFKFRLAVFTGIFMLIFGFVLGIRKLHAFQLRKRYETEKRITALQLSSIKAQMEPHFIFNVINSIGASIYREKKDEAYQLIVRFSHMVRSMLSSSDQLYRTLQEEVDFVTNFLELEKQRFPVLYKYSIDVQEGIDRNMAMPKMILQLHAENAIKHGIMPKGEGGLLEIRITRDEEYLQISIKDNGIGRKASSRIMGQSTGKGLKLLEQLFETYNKYNIRHISQEITDLEDENGKPAGTLVRIRVPLEFNTEIYS